MRKDRLLTPSYCCILAANFLLYFGFYLLIPVLPFFLIEKFGTPEGYIGMILASYTVAALTIRPFSGYLLDTFSRKPLYLFAFFCFTAMFAGYLVAGSVVIFTVLRMAHGLAFGTVTVAGNTVVIDIMPSSRRGEGLGYYGLSNNIAMAVGPMTGLFLHDYYSFDTIFISALLSCSLGLMLATLVKVPKRPPAEHEPLSLDRFILLKGIPAGVALLMLSIPYGITMTYVAIYAREIGIVRNSGLFFTMLALGMAIARLFSGKQVDKGRITQVIAHGMYLVCFCFFLLAMCPVMMEYQPEITVYVFFGIALFLGVGFGTMFPAFNTMFVNLAPNNKRGTATSTYLTSWDLGIGAGLVLGGYISQVSGLDTAYFVGACLTIVSIVFFSYKVKPYFEANRLR